MPLSLAQFRLPSVEPWSLLSSLTSSLLDEILLFKYFCPADWGKQQHILCINNFYQTLLPWRDFTSCLPEETFSPLTSQGHFRYPAYLSSSLSPVLLSWILFCATFCFCVALISTISNCLLVLSVHLLHLFSKRNSCTSTFLEWAYLRPSHACYNLQMRSQSRA